MRAVLKTSTVIVSSLRDNLNTRKQGENENKSESSDFKDILSIEKAILSLFFCGYRKIHRRLDFVELWGDRKVQTLVPNLVWTLSLVLEDV